MHENEIIAGLTYLSIHDVPYRVVRRDETTITAICVIGRKNKEFVEPADRFAEAMSRQQ